MLVDAALTTTDLHAVPDAARAIEAAGYDGIYSFEGQHDAMFPLLLAAEHTERVQLTTAVVIAFARNPMTLAQSAYDLQLEQINKLGYGETASAQPEDPQESLDHRAFRFRAAIRDRKRDASRFARGRPEHGGYIRRIGLDLRGHDQNVLRLQIIHFLKK